jgi:hypothetical protein
MYSNTAAASEDSLAPLCHSDRHLIPPRPRTEAVHAACDARKKGCTAIVTDSQRESIVPTWIGQPDREQGQPWPTPSDAAKVPGTGSSVAVHVARGKQMPLWLIVAGSSYPTTVSGL